MFRQSVVLIAIALSAFAVLSINGREEPEQSVIANFWKHPPTKSYVNDEGLVYDAHWPTYAVVCRNVPEAVHSENRVSETDATLFLMAGPSLNDDNLLNSIPTSARFAIDCQADARGCWVQFTAGLGTNQHVFLLVDERGGNCGEQLRIYAQDVSYNPPPPGENSCQNHTFHERYVRRCVNKPCLADVDDDGYPELLVSELVEWGSSRATSRYAYRVIKHVPKKGLRVVRDLSDAEFDALPNKIPL
ncbi:MAG: hypothetical protein WD065_05220 [Planctomycetaceae bacterium]